MPPAICWNRTRLAAPLGPSSSSLCQFDAYPPADDHFRTADCLISFQSSEYNNKIKSRFRLYTFGELTDNVNLILDTSYRTLSADSEKPHLDRSTTWSEFNSLLFGKVWMAGDNCARMPTEDSWLGADVIRRCKTTLAPDWKRSRAEFAVAYNGSEQVVLPSVDYTTGVNPASTTFPPVSR